MSLVVQEFTYEQRDELALLLTDLLDGRGQFSVCPNPPRSRRDYADRLGRQLPGAGQPRNEIQDSRPGGCVMATFFLGQRVRVNCPMSLRHGEETVVVAIGVPGYEPFNGHYIGIQVALTHSTDGYPLKFEEHELDPILPSGHTASTESFQELMGRLNTQQVEKVEEAGA